MQEKATKWYSDGEIDGLTTNGILIMHPLDGFAGNSKPGIWREVSVDGGIYALRESRSTPQKSSLVCLGCIMCFVTRFFLSVKGQSVTSIDDVVCCGSCSWSSTV